VICYGTEMNAMLNFGVSMSKYKVQGHGGIAYAGIGRCKQYSTSRIELDFLAVIYF